MTDELNGTPPASFWIIGATALVWNLIGLVFYFSHVTMTPDALEGFSEAQQDFFTSTPTWATSAYAIAVTAGVLASLLMLLRKAWAVAMFMLSLLGVVVQQFHAFGLANAVEIWGTEGLVLPALVLIISVALVWYSRNAAAKGWLS